MIIVRKSDDRGHFDQNWLKTYHTFSFGEYQDENHIKFRSLRVINEDRIAPEKGFSIHTHKNMEIITYIIEGQLAHMDDMGHSSIIHTNGVQKMSAGSGVKHSEYNHSKIDWLHLLQIWIIPDKLELNPEYEHRYFSGEEKRNNLHLIASPDGRNDSLKIHQKASIYATILETGNKIIFPHSNRYTWIQVISGELCVSNVILNAGDGVALKDEETIELNAIKECHFILFDLA